MQHEEKMSGRALWALSLPLALLAWVGILFFTGALPPTSTTEGAFLFLLALAMTMTSAPFVWLVARRLHISGAGERPALALRVGFWIGLWTAGCVGLRFAGFFNWAIALTFAAILGLLETFLQQVARQRAVRRD
jgi:hypothetical protein